MKPILLPQEISDGRLDTILKIFGILKSGNIPSTSLQLDWTHVSSITPAGYAILACLFDTAVEQKVTIRNLRIKKIFQTSAVIRNLNKIREYKSLPDPGIHNFENSETLLEGHGSAVFPQFMDRVERKFQSILSEDLAFSSRLIINELMVNCVDHSTAERYYLYAGKKEREFHVGVLDMGITIPAKLERKYSAKNDVELLELSLKEGISTRRQKVGGLGLYLAFEHLKQNKGKLTILSRNAQIRRYFNRKSVIRGPLKHTLDGTWCFARFPLWKVS